MKKILLPLLIFAISTSLTAQNLLLSQVLDVRKQNLAGAEEYLTQRQWSLVNVKAPESGKFGILGFAYKKDNFSDKAESFITLYYAENENTPNRINIQIHKTDKYNEYINQIKKWGGKLYDSYIEDDVFFKIYQGSTMTYIVDSSTQESDFSSNRTIYSFYIMPNESFKYSSYNRK